MIFSKTAETQQKDLEAVLYSCPSQNDFLKVAQWVVQVLHWIRSDSRFRDESQLERHRLPVVRLKYFLRYLNQHEGIKKTVQSRLSFLLSQIRTVEIFSDIGLHRGRGFLQEFSARLFDSIFLEAPFEKNLATLFLRFFPESDDAIWIQNIDDSVFLEFVALLKNGESQPSDWIRFRKEGLTALVLLGTQIQASALHSLIRSRLGVDDPAHSCFFRVNELTLECYHAPIKTPEFMRCAKSLRHLIIDCKIELSRVYEHLRDNGVSVGVVYQVEKIYIELERMLALLAVLEANSLEPKKIKHLFAQLIEGVHQQSQLWPFLQQNLKMITKRVIDRNSEIGEHYITRTTSEYLLMLKKAAGGGFLTAFTVFMKIIVFSLPLSQLVTGLLASLNYAVSFVCIQWMGFTLATKQPASTAPLLASKLKHSKIAGFDDVLDELQNLIRSQFVAVVGNILLVIPTALLIAFVYEGFVGYFPVSKEKAEYIVHSTDLLGPSAIYAIFTGFLLFSSSLVAGWADNWFALHKVKERLLSNEKLTQLLSSIRVAHLGHFFQEHIAGLGGSISLGCMLGLLPEILKFIGLPLDVRHVTLSSGSLAAALPSLGFSFVTTEAFWRAFIGILLIGFLNVISSFAFAFGFALLATHIRGQERRSIFKLLLMRFFKKPLSFFFPIS